MEVSNISVIGTGIMGLGITRLIALSKYNVMLRSRTAKSLKRGIERIKLYFKNNLRWNRITSVNSNTAIGRTNETISHEEAEINTNLVVKLYLKT
jgi:3-hydroxyacyl-CoA dehydrogenase